MTRKIEELTVADLEQVHAGAKKTEPKKTTTETKKDDYYVITFSDVLVSS